LLSDWDLSLGDLSGLAVSSLDIDGSFSSPHLDVSLRRKIGADSTVCSISSSSTLGGSVDLNVINGDVFQIFRCGIGLQVVKKAENDSD
jgi:hypothetical protein